MLNADRALYKIYIAVDCVYHFAGRVALHIFGVLVMARQLYLVKPLHPTVSEISNPDYS